MLLLLLGVEKGFIDICSDKIDDFVSLCLGLDNVEIAKQLQMYKWNKNKKNRSTNANEIQKIPNGNMKMLVRMLTGEHVAFSVDPNERISNHSIKKAILFFLKP